MKKLNKYFSAKNLESKRISHSEDLIENLLPYVLKTLIFKIRYKIYL